MENDSKREASSPSEMAGDSTERRVGPLFESSAFRQIVILASSIVLAVASLYVVLTLARPIAILLASIIIAVALSPVVGYLERRVPRGAAVVMVYAGLVLLGLILFATVGVAIADEVRDAVENAPRDRAELVEFVAEYGPISETQADTVLPDEWPDLTSFLTTVPVNVVSALAELVIAFFLSVYWLLAAPSLRRYFLSMFVDGGRESRAADVLDAIGFKMGGYVRTLAVDAILLGTVTYIGLTLLDIRLASLLALIHGLSVFVPIIGPITAAVPAVLVALTSSPLQAGAVLVFYVVIQQIESNVLLPNVMRRQAEINPLLVVFAIFAGGSIGNILGALIAVPIAGAIQVLVTDVLAPMIHGKLAGEEADSSAAQSESGQ